MTATVTIWSSLVCPWATTAVCRLRRARDQHGLDVVFDVRAWPLELVNETGTPHPGIAAEVALLGSHEPELFNGYRADTWPSTLLPAFELVAAARRVGGVRAAEAVDWAIRLRLFRDGADVSMAHELRKAAENAGNDTGLDAGTLMRVWETEPVRADVFADYRASKAVDIQGSPQVLWPDGTTTHNPGFTMGWERGLPRITKADPDEPGRLLLESLRNHAAGAGVSPTT